MCVSLLCSLCFFVCIILGENAIDKGIINEKVVYNYLYALCFLYRMWKQDYFVIGDTIG
jgi:hypothetical protein